jgi:4-amino-4-deoxy-L-arabinose transferase-like glycosyltransferase
VIGFATQTSAARHAAIAVAIAAGVIALRSPLWDLPLERDEGEYAYIAWRMAAGETPYLHWFDQKPPGVFLAYRVALAWPGDPVVAIRAVAALFCAASALATFALARAVLGQTAGAVAAVLLALLSADPMLQGPIANTEIFMVPWIVGAALLTWRTLGAERPRLATALAIGLALGVATAFKQVALVNAPFFVAMYAWHAPSGARGRATARFAAAMAAGGLSIWAAILGWFWLRGGLAPALDAILFHNLEYAADLPLAVRRAAFAYYVTPLLPSQGAAWALAALGLALLARRSDRVPAVFLGGFAAANAVGVSASGFYFPHYFQQILPAVAVLAAAAIAGVGPARAPIWRLAGAGALAVVPLAAAAIGFWRISPEVASRRIYPGNEFAAMPAIAAEVAAQTERSDRVFVFGSDPEIYFHARRIAASRYIFLFPLFGAFSDVERRQAEVIADVEAAHPAAIVWAPVDFGSGGQQFAEWMRSYIGAHYRPHAAARTDRDGRPQVYRIAPEESAGAALADPSHWATVFVRSDG